MDTCVTGPSGRLWFCERCLLGTAYQEIRPCLRSCSSISHPSQPTKKAKDIGKPVIIYAVRIGRKFAKERNSWNSNSTENVSPQEMRTATTIDAPTKRRVGDVFRFLRGGRWIRLVCLSRRSSTSKRSHTTYHATMLRCKLHWSCCASPHCAASYGDNVSRRTTHVYLMQHHVCCNLKYGRDTLRDKVARKMPARIITPN